MLTYLIHIISCQEVSEPVRNDYATISFDEGPSDNIYPLLEILKEQDIFVTFHLSPRRIKTALFEEIKKNGHDIGLYAEELPNDYEEFVRITGYEPKFCRLPYYGYDEEDVKIAEQLGMIVSRPNLDSEDNELEEWVDLFVNTVEESEIGLSVVFRDRFDKTIRNVERAIMALKEKYEIVDLETFYGVCNKKSEGRSSCPVNSHNKLMTKCKQATQCNKSLSCKSKSGCNSNNKCPLEASRPKKALNKEVVDVDIDELLAQGEDASEALEQKEKNLLDRNSTENLANPEVTENEQQKNEKDKTNIENQDLTESANATETKNENNEQQQNAKGDASEDNQGLTELTNANETTQDILDENTVKDSLIELLEDENVTKASVDDENANKVNENIRSARENLEKSTSKDNESDKKTDETDTKTDRTDKKSESGCVKIATFVGLPLLTMIFMC